jgi:DNA primase
MVGIYTLLDALTLWSAGLRNVTSSYGVNGWTAEHWQMIEELKPERIILCFDNDEAGNRASERIGKELTERGIEVRRAKLPPGKDINEVAQKSKDPSLALATVIEGASEMSFALKRTETANPLQEAQSTPEESPFSLAALPLAAAPEPVATTLEQSPPEEATKEKSVSADKTAQAETCRAVVPSPGTQGESESDRSAVASAKAELLEDQLELGFGEPLKAGSRLWRVRGIAKNLSYETLKVQLRGDGWPKIPPRHAGPVQRQTPAWVFDGSAGGNRAGQRNPQKGSWRDLAGGGRAPGNLDPQSSRAAKRKSFFRSPISRKPWSL